MKINICFYITFFMLSYSFAQTPQTINLTLPAVMVVDLESSSSTHINLAATTPGEAGAQPLLGTNSALWLNFTSAVLVGRTRRILVSRNNLTLNGVAVYVEAKNLTGGAGVRGVPKPNVELGLSAKELITGIGGAYTGNGPGQGYNLFYSLAITNFSSLLSGSSSITVLYTIVEE